MIVKLIISAKSRAKNQNNAKIIKIYVLVFLDTNKSIDAEREIINALPCARNQIVNIYVSIMLVMIAMIHMIVATNIHAIPNVKTNLVSGLANMTQVLNTIYILVENLNAFINVNSVIGNVYFLIIFIKS